MLLAGKKAKEVKEDEEQVKLIQDTICWLYEMKRCQTLLPHSTSTSTCFSHCNGRSCCSCCCSPVAKFMFTVALIKFNMHIAKAFEVGQTVRPSVRQSKLPVGLSLHLPSPTLYKYYQELVVGLSTMCVCVCVCR